MWSDNETLTDCIDYTHLIGAVSGIINNDDLLPCSIGIFGDWGSGKSSLMGMLEEKYKDNDDVLVVKFNGWLFEGYEDAKTVLMGRIVDEIVMRKKMTPEAIKFVARILKRIDIMKVGSSALKYGIGYAMMGPVGAGAVALGDMMGKLKEVNYEDYVKAKIEGKDDESVRTNIQEFHSNFESLIKVTNIKKIIVFIDDLDRCSPDTIIGTLEAIKLFLFTKSTAFVIGADERLIKYAVRRRFPEIPGDSTEVGRDYLEKLIQYPIRIPPLNTIELTNYVNLLFSQLHIDVGEFGIARENIMTAKQAEGFDFIFDDKNAGVYFNDVNEALKESFQLSAQIVPILSVGLNGNPRQCKRFLNALLIRYSMAKSKGIDLSKRVLAKLMLLEYFRPETFAAFHKEQAMNQGALRSIGKLEGIAKDPESESSKEAVKLLTTEQAAFLKDSWLDVWLKSEPSLDRVNLQPYYYFSRDRLTDTGLSLQRMSPAAQDFFSKLLNGADYAWTTTLNKASGLSDGDAAAVFEASTTKIKETEDGEYDQILKRLIGFTKKRPEHISQIIAFLDNLPVKSIPLTVVTGLDDLTKNTAYRDPARALLTKWSAVDENNKNLAKISRGKLKDF